MHLALLPAACVRLAIPLQRALPVSLVVDELSSVGRAIGPRVSAHSVQFASGEITFIDTSVLKLVYALSRLLVVYPGSFVSSAVLFDQNTLAMSRIVLPFSIVEELSVRGLNFTLTVLRVLIEIT